MLASESVREIMKIKNVRPSVLCSRLGIKSNALCSRLNARGISVSKLNETLRALDYKIVIVPRETRLPDGGIEIE